MALPRKIAVLAFDGAQLLDIAGPLEVFGSAHRWLKKNRLDSRGYEVEVLAERAGPVTSSSKVAVVANRGFGSVRGSLDTLLVAGGDGVEAVMANQALGRWLVQMKKRVRRLGSVCTGAFVLAQFGLLDGRRAATHWAHCDQLARAFPKVQVDRDALYLRDKAIVTSAGVTAGMDLALWLVEEDHGRDVALAVAQNLVLFLYRSGGQSQFSPQMTAQLAEHAPIREIQNLIVNHPWLELSVSSLARRAGWSPRQFARLFKREVGVTPARYVESARVDVARRRLESSRDGVERIAADCGFGTAESMRRRFLNCIGTTPSAYRIRFTNQELK